jgi:hypothetical protein
MEPMNARILTKIWSLLSVMLVLSLVAAPAAFADTLDSDVIKGSVLKISSSEASNIVVSVKYTLAFKGSNNLSVGDVVTIKQKEIPYPIPNGYEGLPYGSLPDVSITVPTPWSTGKTITKSSTLSFTAPTSPGTYKYYGEMYVEQDYGSKLSANNLNVKIELTVRDTTGPTISIIIPEDGQKITKDSVEEADYECSDPAGVYSCQGVASSPFGLIENIEVNNGFPLYTTLIGSFDFTVNAEDFLGNSSSLSHTYSVIYDFAGFFAPVDNLDEYGNPILNKVKAGSAIPVKFSLAGDQGMGIFTSGPTSVSIACEAGSATAAVEETVSSTSSHLNYDAGEDQYVYVWKTDKGWSNSCRRFTFTLQDGTVHTADFQFTR